MASVSVTYLWFFIASFLVLFLIGCVKAPECIRYWERFFRQMKARKTRGQRMLADLEKLKSDARKLEGIYRFEGIEPHHSPAHPLINSEAGSGVGSGVPCR